MFGKEPGAKRPSLLMLAKGEAGQQTSSSAEENIVPMPHSSDAVAQHRRAKAARRSARPNPLLSALGKNESRNAIGSAPSSQAAEAVEGIERDIDALINDDVHAGERDLQQQAAPAPAYDEQPQHYHQQPSYAVDETFKPLIDPTIMLQAMWRWRWPIIGLTALGGIIGAGIAISTPHHFSAYSKVLIDPREVKLVERDLTPEFLGNEAALAIVDSQLETVTSTPVLEEVVKRLNLDQNAEFNGQADSGIGLLDGIAFVRSLFSSETPVDTTERETIENLRESVGVYRNPRTFVFEIYAQAQSPRLAADISNALTKSFIDFQTGRQVSAARDASTALGGQVSSLKQAVEKAEQAATKFAQENGLTKVDGQTLSDGQLVATSAQLGNAKAATIRAKSLAQAAQEASVDQVVNGGLPPELVTPGLNTFREQFSSLSQNAAALEQALGPRHPRLANAIAARDAARDEIAAELRRIVAGTQSTLRSAVRSEQEIAASLAQAKSESGTTSEAAVKLRELEADIEAARTLYKAALLRSGETNQLEELARVNASIIAAAEPPLSPSSVSRKVVTIAGAMTGFLAGAGLAFLFGLRDCLRANSGRQNPSPSPRSTPPQNGRRQHAPAQTPNDPAHTTSGQPAFTPQHVTANSETPMYPGAPYQPYAQYPQQPQQQMMQTQMPMYQGYMQGVQPPQPQMQYSQPMMQPMGYAPQPMPMAYPQQPMMQPQPFAPMPQTIYIQTPAPAMPSQHQGEPAYAPQPAPVPAPQQTAPTPNAEEAELAELRASVRDIRDVVDHLAQSRGTSRRFG